MKKNIFLPVFLSVYLLLVQPALATALHEAAAKGDLASVQQLLKAGADLNDVDENGNSVMRRAVTGGQLDVVKFLIARGADKNEKRQEYEPSLLNLASIRSLKVANYLLSVGAESTPMDMELLLGRAAFDGDEKTLSRLLKQGVNINAYALPVNANEMTNGINYDEEVVLQNPLGHAIQQGRANIIGMLLKNGARVDQNHIGMAICNGNLKLLHQLAKQLAETTDSADQLQGDKSASYLVRAITCGNKEVLAYLMSEIKPVNYVEVINQLWQHTANISLELFAELFSGDADLKLHASGLLKAAVTANNYKLAVYLLDKGASLPQEEMDYAMLTVAQEGYGEMLALLLKNGGKVDARSAWGNTPLLRAVPYNRVSSAAMLLKSGADVNAKNELLNTPLHMAAARNLTGMATLLIDNGARINAINEDGNTPLHQAVRHTASMDTIKLLLSKKAKINVKNGEGMTVLHLLALQNPESKIQPRTSHRDNAGANDEDQSVASWQRPYGRYFEGANRTEAIKLLVDNGADLNIKDKDGDTPLELEMKYSKDAEFLNYLKERAKIAAR
jgi:ankyrin repeat protein